MTTCRCARWADSSLHTVKYAVGQRAMSLSRVRHTTRRCYQPPQEVSKVQVCAADRARTCEVQCARSGRLFSRRARANRLFECPRVTRCTPRARSSTWLSRSSESINFAHAAALLFFEFQEAMKAAADTVIVLSKE